MSGFPGRHGPTITNARWQMDNSPALRDLVAARVNKQARQKARSLMADFFFSNSEPISLEKWFGEEASAGAELRRDMGDNTR